MIGVRWHYVRHQVFANALVIAYSITEGMLADVGTKWLARKKLARFAIISSNPCIRTGAKTTSIFATSVPLPLSRNYRPARHQLTTRKRKATTA